MLGDFVEQLVDDMPESMARAKVPGVSLSMLRDRQPIWSESFGMTRKDSGEPVGPTPSSRPPRSANRSSHTSCSSSSIKQYWSSIGH